MDRAYALDELGLCFRFVIPVRRGGQESRALLHNLDSTFQWFASNSGVTIIVSYLRLQQLHHRLFPAETGLSIFKRFKLFLALWNKFCVVLKHRDCFFHKAPNRAPRVVNAAAREFLIKPQE